MLLLLVTDIKILTNLKTKDKLSFTLINFC